MALRSLAKMATRRKLQAASAALQRVETDYRQLGKSEQGARAVIRRRRADLEIIKAAAQAVFDDRLAAAQRASTPTETAERAVMQMLKAAVAARRPM